MTASLRLTGVMRGGLLPALAAAQSVTYDYSHSQDFSRLRTSTFKNVQKTDNPLVDERIAAAVAALESRETDQSPDFEDVREVSPDPKSLCRHEPIATGGGGDGGRL